MPHTQASEGIDFANGNARGVLVVGIPFPNVKDTKVGLKKAYNSNAPRSLQLLDGNTWYSQQAFRALNQVGPWQWAGWPLDAVNLGALTRLLLLLM